MTIYRQSALIAGTAALIVLMGGMTLSIAQTAAPQEMVLGDKRSEATASEINDDKSQMTIPVDDAAMSTGKIDDNDKPEADNAAEESDENNKELTIASWGGAYEKSQDLAFFAPFAKESGITVNTTSYDGDLSVLKPEDGGTPASWDVVDLTLAAAEKACNTGLLELIDPADLEPAVDGTSAKDDFIGEGLHSCAVASMAWSSLIVFDKGAFKKKVPESLNDFFNVKAFPGKRALSKGPKYNLELALMADGVAPEKVYATLMTDEGLARALKKLSTIRRHIVWWDKAQEPLELLNKKTVVMTTAYSGRTFFKMAGENRPYGLIWDGQIYDLDLWAIPRTAKNKKAAIQFISYATKPERLAAQTKWFPYGPMRKSAVPLIGKHAEVGIDMAPFVPTASQNFKTALGVDPVWWDRQEERLTERFAAWLAKPPVAKKTSRKRRIRKKRKKKK